MFAAISYDPLVSIDLGPLSVSPHGIFTGVGVVVGAWFLLRDVRRAGFDVDVVTSILTRAVIAALIGARLAYVVNHWSRFDSVFEVLRLWEGGASLLGGLTAALVVAVVELRRRRLPVLVLLDLAAPWFLVGIAVGRIGDLIIADHLGTVTTASFGFQCPDVVDVGETVGSPCPPGEVVHLTALYDLVWASVAAGVVWWIRRRTGRTGVAIGVTGLLYGLGRFVLDGFRADAIRFGLTGSRWTGLILILVSLGVLVVAIVRSDRNGVDDAPAEADA
ncbi:MAG: prolipoprotein diacylglyceryl transferase [Acidimicrobiales bacterium]